MNFVDCFVIGIKGFVILLGFMCCVGFFVLLLALLSSISKNRSSNNRDGFK